MASLDAFDILRDQDDAMTVMPDKIGANVVPSDNRGLFL